MKNIQPISKEIQKSFIGNNSVVEKILLVLLAGGHVLLEDIPGVGKTTLALACSNVMALSYNRVQFTPDVMPTDITGFSIYRKDTGKMVYQPGAAMCNLLLADELNRAPSRTQAALLEVMEEYSVTVDGVTHQLPEPFMVIATQNPYGSAGTQLLPESQMDRFMMKLSIGYPNKQSEIEMLHLKHGDTPAAIVSQIADSSRLVEIRKIVSKTYLSEEIYEYIVELIQATRSHPLISQGASPRCTVALMALAQAAAFANGRDYVLPQDVKAVYQDCTAHRLILDTQAMRQKITSHSLLAEILSTVPAPKPGITK